MQLIFLFFFHSVFIHSHGTTLLKCKTARESGSLLLNLNGAAIVRYTGVMVYRVVTFSQHQSINLLKSPASTLVLRPNDRCLTFLCHISNCLICIAPSLQSMRDAHSYSHKCHSNLPSFYCFCDFLVILSTSPIPLLRFENTPPLNL